jgi:hypothetical protein
LAQANQCKQIGLRKPASPPIAADDFCKKNQSAFLARLDFATHSPYIKRSWAFCLFSMLWSLFGEQGSGFFIAFAAIDGT